MSHSAPDLHSLPSLRKPDLIRIWTKVFGKPPRIQACREFLLSHLSWHLQAKQHGGLPPTIQRQLESLSHPSAAGRSPRPRTPAPRLPPGTTLLKTWQGRQYTVTVQADGFEFDGKTYASLSEIVRVMTGTRWNGPAFFGLRTKPTKKNKGGEANGQ